MICVQGEKWLICLFISWLLVGWSVHWQVGWVGCLGGYFPEQNLQDKFQLCETKRLGFSGGVLCSERHSGLGLFLIHCIILLLLKKKKTPQEMTFVFYCLRLSSSCPPSLQLGPLPHQIHREHQPEDLP